jgi:tRNA U38,U39,U40 pseudouridine synthase TruA
MSDLSGTKQLKDDKSVLIFSKRVTFDNGMGVYLPKLASAGIRMAVIMDENNTRQRKLIDEMNRSLPEELRITYASSVPEVMNMTRASRSYYYKIEGDPDAGIKGVVTFDITGIVRQIIEALGKAAGVIEDGLIERMHMAARRFAEAA